MIYKYVKEQYVNFILRKRFKTKTFQYKIKNSPK